MKVIDVLFPVIGRQEESILHQSISAIMDNSSYNSTSSVSTPNSAIIDDCDTFTEGKDIESIKGHYGWKVFGKCKLPVIIRVVNGQHLNYICKRLVESKLCYNLNYDYLHQNIFKYISVKCQLMSVAEAKLLNDINSEDDSQNLGIEIFEAGQDSIVHEDAVQELYTFIDFCYNKLKYINICPNNEKCGYILINKMFVVPYYIIDNKKYIPLFCFEDEDNCLMDQAIEIDNWDFAYIKFCLMIMDIKDTTDEIYTKQSCIGTTLEVIMNNFTLNTSFEEFFPRMVKNIQFRSNVDNYISPPYLSVPQNTQMIHNNYYENGWPGNQMVYSSYSTQPQPFPIVQQNKPFNSNVNVAGQYYYTGSPTFQHSGLMNNIQFISLPSPIVNVDGTLLTSNNATSNYNIASTNQPMIANVDDTLLTFNNATSNNNISPINQPMTANINGTLLTYNNATSNYNIASTNQPMMTNVDDTLLTFNNATSNNNISPINQPMTANVNGTLLTFNNDTSNYNVAPTNQPTTVNVDGTLLISNNATLNYNIAPTNQPMTANVNGTLLTYNNDSSNYNIATTNQPMIANVNGTLLTYNNATSNYNIASTNQPMMANVDDTLLTFNNATSNNNISPINQPMTANVNGTLLTFNNDTSNYNVAPTNQPTTVNVDGTLLISNNATLNYNIAPTNQPMTANVNGTLLTYKNDSSNYNIATTNQPMIANVNGTLLTYNNATSNYNIAPTNQPMIANVNGTLLTYNNATSNNNISPTNQPMTANVNGTLLTYNNDSSNYNIAPTNQPTTTMYNPVINPSVMPNSNQMRQFYSIQSPYVNFKHQEQYNFDLQQQHHYQHQQNLYRQHCRYQNQQNLYRQQSRYQNLCRQQQDMQHLYYDESTTHRSSSPLNSAQTSYMPQCTFRISATGLVLCKIPERHYYMPYPAYKLQFVTLYGSKVTCINSTSYIYGDLMMMLSELVEILLLRSCTIERCVHVLYKYFKIVLYSPNHEQIGIFYQYNIARSLSPDDMPMVMFKDIYRVFLHLRYFVVMPDEQIDQLLYVGSENIVVGPSQLHHNIYQI